MSTEGVSPRFDELDTWSSRDIIDAMYEAQLSAAAAVREALGSIDAAVEDALPALRRGGRIVYAGAGTSGRIGVQDGSELPPTFGWPRDRLVFAMAGGSGALLDSIEGAEDDETAGARAMTEAWVGPDDVVIGIAASGATPYTVAALAAAGAAGAITIGIANNPGSPLLEAARHRILVNTGPEVIAGSTRMKAGTAQKIVLNLLSSALMVGLGLVYRGQMVHMQASNAKLLRRAEGMVARIVGCTPPEAARYLAVAEGDVKTAILISLGLDVTQAQASLARKDGNLRDAIQDANIEARQGSRDASATTSPNSARGPSNVFEI